MTNWYKVRIILLWWSCTPTSRTSLQGCTYILCGYFRKFLYSNIRGVGVKSRVVHEIFPIDFSIENKPYSHARTLHQGVRYGHFVGITLQLGLLAVLVYHISPPFSIQLPSNFPLTQTAYTTPSPLHHCTRPASDC